MRRSLVETLKGILPNKQQKIEQLQKHVAQSDSLKILTGGQNWHVMQAILDGFYNEAVQELGTKNLLWLGWRRLNHRVELLHDIQRDVRVIITRGDDAQQQLDRISKEEDNGRRG